MGWGVLKWGVVGVMEWNEMERNGVEFTGMKRNEMEGNGMGRGVLMTIWSLD